MAAHDWRSGHDGGVLLCRIRIIDVAVQSRDYCRGVFPHQAGLLTLSAFLIYTRDKKLKQVSHFDSEQASAYFPRVLLLPS